MIWGVEMSDLINLKIHVSNSYRKISKDSIFCIDGESYILKKIISVILLDNSVGYPERIALVEGKFIKREEVLK